MFDMLQCYVTVIFRIHMYMDNLMNRLVTQVVVEICFLPPWGYLTLFKLYFVEFLDSRAFKQGITHAY